MSVLLLHCKRNGKEISLYFFLFLQKDEAEMPLWGTLQPYYIPALLHICSNKLRSHGTVGDIILDKLAICEWTLSYGFGDSLSNNQNMRKSCWASIFPCWLLKSKERKKKLPREKKEFEHMFNICSSFSHMCVYNSYCFCCLSFNNSDILAKQMVQPTTALAR